MELVLCGPVARLPMPLWLLGMRSSAVFGVRSAGQDVHNLQPMLDKQKVQAGLCFELLAHQHGQEETLGSMRSQRA